MNTSDKLKEAKRLMCEVTKERKIKLKEDIANKVCKCGHKRKSHSDTHSINYTGGFCNKCDCENFLIK